MSTYAACHSVPSLSLQTTNFCQTLNIVQSSRVKLINTCDDHRVDHRILETRPRSDLTQLVILPLSEMYFLCQASKD